MDRRAVLKSVGGSVAFLATGGLSRAAGKVPEQHSIPSKGSADTHRRREIICDIPPKPELKARNFEVVSTQCGTGENTSSASFEGGCIRLSGTIRGTNSCYTAEIEKVTHSGGGPLIVWIRSYDPEDAAICLACITDVEYNAAFTFDNGIPTRVMVIHNDTVVLNEQR